MPIAQSQTSITLLHPKGSSVEILFYGATIISWKSASHSEDSQPLERLFLSSKTALDGSKPVRGGIPVVFPIFGPPPLHSKLSQHGFARSETWSLTDTLLDDEAGVSVKFELVLSPALLEKYPFPCKLGYVVTLAAHQLTANLLVENTGAGSLEFQALLHTYLRVPVHSTTVVPLKGLTYTNKTKPGSPKEVEARMAVDTHSFTDFVYEKAGGTYNVLSNGVSTLEIRTNGFADVVIWNPGEENAVKMADMDDDGWNYFICVEPGTVSSFIKLEVGKSWSGQQVLTVL